MADFGGSVRKSNRDGICRPEWLSLNVSLQRLNLLGLPAFGAFHHFELHCLTFFKATESIRLNGGEVNEHVLTGLTADESKTLCIVEPLNGSLFHNLFFPFICWFYGNTWKGLCWQDLLLLK